MLLMCITAEIMHRFFHLTPKLFLRTKRKKKAKPTAVPYMYEPLFFSPLHPIYYPRTSLALPPSSSSSNSDPGSHSGPLSPLPTTATAVCAFIFIARIQHFLPSSTRVANFTYNIPTLLGVLSSSKQQQQQSCCMQLIFFFALPQKLILTTVGIEPKDQRYVAEFEGTKALDHRGDRLYYYYV